MTQGTSPQILVNFIAIYWLLSGLLTAKWAHGIRWRAGTRIGFAAGILAVATGALLLARSALDDILDAETLIIAVALTTVANGCLRMIGAFEFRERTGRRWTLGGIALGSVEIAIGIVLLMVRDTDSDALRITIGIWGVVAGTLLCAQAYQLLRIRRSGRLTTELAGSPRQGERDGR